MLCDCGYYGLGRRGRQPSEHAVEALARWRGLDSTLKYFAWMHFLKGRVEAGGGMRRLHRRGDDMEVALCSGHVLWWGRRRDKGIDVAWGAAGRRLVSFK